MLLGSWYAIKIKKYLPISLLFSNSRNLLSSFLYIYFFVNWFKPLLFVNWFAICRSCVCFCNVNFYWLTYSSFSCKIISDSLLKPIWCKMFANDVYGQFGTLDSLIWYLIVILNLLSLLSKCYTRKFFWKNDIHKQYLEIQHFHRKSNWVLLTTLVMRLLHCNQIYNLV